MDKFGETLIGEHPSIQKIRELITTTADTMFNVLIIGESGVGKKLVGKIMHRSSSFTKDKPLKIVNCVETPSVYINIALFGHEKGAFPDADKMNKGALELADGGTVILESVHAMPFHVQQKLLDCLYDSFFTRLGGGNKIKLNCRIIATTEPEIDKLMENNLFFSSLYYKLNIINFEIPPLRERGEDIILLLNYFLHEYPIQFKKPHIQIDDTKVMDLLRSYYWPGNVKELENIVKMGTILRNWDFVKKELHKGKRLPARTDKPEEKSSLLVKFIEFPPELYQSGMSILSYFGTFLRKQYPDKRIKLRIEQEELKIRMVVETLEGELESVEKSLTDYGKIMKGEISPDDFFDSKTDAIELKQQLRIARVQLETQKELLALKDGEIRRTSERIDFLEAQFGKLTDIVDKNLGYSSLAVTNFSDLLERMSKRNNALITEAVQILKDKAERGIIESDEVYVKQALKTIKDEDPSVFQQVVDVLLRGGVSSAMGNLIYSWAMAISAAFPK